MEPLQIRISESAGDAVVVRLKGEFDVSAESLFSRAITDGVMQDGYLTVIVDLSELSFLDSTGLHALLRARDVARGRGMRLVVSRPQPAIRRVMDLAGVGNEFEILESFPGA
jgi:anti-sigma B factor antagonist